MLNIYFISSLLYSRVEIIFHVFLKETYTDINEHYWILSTSENYIQLVEHIGGLIFNNLFFKSGSNVEVLSNQTQLIPVPTKMTRQTLSTLWSSITWQNCYHWVAVHQATKKNISVIG